MAVCASEPANTRVIPWILSNHNKGLCSYYTNVKKQEYKSMKPNGCLRKQICNYSCDSTDSAKP